MKPKNQKIIVVLGPTSAGKSDLAVRLASWLAHGKLSTCRGAEIISADSRQIYKGMDIGSGKITEKERRGIPHRLLSVASPKRRFSAGRFAVLAKKNIRQIADGGKLPIICGGAAFYIDAVLGEKTPAPVEADWSLRKQLSGLSTAELFEKLKKIDPEKAKTIDSKNPHRLIRAIEVGMAPSSAKSFGRQNGKNSFAVLKIGINKPPEELKERIAKRLTKRLKHGLIEETAALRRSGLSWRRLESFGLEYKLSAQYLQEKISREEMIEKIKTESWRLAKRQMTWWKKDKDIRWVKNDSQAKKLIKEFLAIN